MEEKITLEKKIILEVTEKTMSVIFTGLLELPSKISLSVIQDLDQQYHFQMEKNEIIDQPKV